MNTQTIAGGGGVQLHVVEAGHPDGRAIRFIHGFSQSSLAWSRQLDSESTGDHRLVAMDLRGHGLSDKPRDADGDSRLWADDVHAVIDGLVLDRPVLCGWSYGALVILDYLRHYGEDRLAASTLSVACRRSAQGGPRRRRDPHHAQCRPRTVLGGCLRVQSTPAYVR